MNKNNKYGLFGYSSRVKRFVQKSIIRVGIGFIAITPKIAHANFNVLELPITVYGVCDDLSTTCSEFDTQVEGVCDDLSTTCS